MASPLSVIYRSFEKFFSEINKIIKDGNIPASKIGTEQKYVVFLSIGNESIRAITVRESGKRLDNVVQKLQDKAINLVRKRHVHPQWIKLDIVSEVEEISFADLERKIANTRRNYFRYGISFDPSFILAFLEQEINGNALIRQQTDETLRLDERNINYYLRQKEATMPTFFRHHYANKNVYIFKTKSLFVEDDQLHYLYNGPLTNGIRKVSNIKDEVKSLITKATYYLMNSVKDTGQFEYGYFSAFAKKINTYNILRHSSSLYSMVEGYEIIKDQRVLEAVERGLTFLINEAIVYKDDAKRIAFVVDHANDSEIKLGSNATAILAMTKYMEVTGSDRYLEIARALARGIIEMKLPDEGFIHVLNYPTFNIKDMYRIIYYEGEAIFALLRLYAIDRDEYWLEEVKKTFEFFIDNEYWKYHDHWLSYAANELTIYEPKDKYFIFGLRNSQERLKFIYHRETTFPTFLELTMATYKMIKKIKELDKEYLLEHIDEDFLIETIDRRAEYQRVGFFYPELAMYKKFPKLILNGFFIRHHSFRVRIDDVEHYLSGYCQYLLHRIPDLEDYDLTISNL